MYKKELEIIDAGDAEPDRYRIVTKHNKFEPFRTKNLCQLDITLVWLMIWTCQTYRYACSTVETFLQYFLVIMKRMLQNY